MPAGRRPRPAGGRAGAGQDAAGAHARRRRWSWSFKRMQFTPDLMPGDITGTEVIEEDRTTGRRAARFIRGPVFTNVLLADEINRTPPKTQAALLEAMQERQRDRRRRATMTLPRPVLRAGHAEPDRAGGHLSAARGAARPLHVRHPPGLPDRAEEEVRDPARHHGQCRTPTSSRCWTRSGCCTLQRWVREVPVADNVFQYAASLVRATRPGDAERAGGREALGALGRRAARGAGADPGRQGERAAQRPLSRDAGRHPPRGRPRAAPPRAGELSRRGRGHLPPTA